MISLTDLPLRDDLVGQEPYGAPQLKVEIVLNVNENPYPPSPLIRQEMAEAIAEMAAQANRYPDREASALRAALANYLGHGLSADQVWAANGSNEIMAQLLTAFGGPRRRMLTFTPTYSMYPEYARNTCTEFVTAPRKADYTLDADTILAAIAQHQPTVVVIATPNNPTGTLTPPEVIAEVAQNTDAIIVVDEAYQEFSTQPSAITVLNRCPRVVVTRTMSKAFALAGGRLGYLAAAPAIVDAMRIVRLPYHLSAQTQTIAQVALAHTEELLAQVHALAAEARAFEAWARAQGYETIPSEANFSLIGRFIDRHQVFTDLLNRGILIRETGPAGFLRVSAGTPKEMAALRAALTELNPPTEGAQQ